MAVFHTNDLILNGTYRIEKQIGQGAFGDVYLATYLPLGVDRAIKVVRKGDGLGSTEFEQYRDRFRQEAKLGATFSNANIIHVDQFEEGDGELFLIMDYAPGGSLADQIDQYREKKIAIPVERAVQWVSEAADGLARLHENDMVHRDVKPSNILLDANGHAYIADLGLVQLPTSRSVGSGLGRNHPGTPEYMPPEQLPGNYLPLRASADVYSLGCVLFELLTEKQYYHRPEGTRVASLRPDVPVWLDEITAKALAPQAGDRFRDAGELLESIQRRSSKSAKLVNQNFPETGIPVQIKQMPAPEESLPPSLYYSQKSEIKDAEPEDKRNLSGLWIGIAAVVIVGLIILVVNLANKNTGIPAQAQLPTATDVVVAVEVPTVAATLLPATTIPLAATETMTATAVPTVAPTSTPALGIGSSQLSPIDGMKMMYVPAGEFLMGTPNSAGGGDEHPQHPVTLDAFWIDQTEVTNSMYAKCVAARQCTQPQSNSSKTRGSYYSNPDYNEYPVIWVNWYQATAYCQWAGRNLPTEAQWEKAARGVDGGDFPWGNGNANSSLANYSTSDTVQVGSFPAGKSLYGALDMAGNVWEWVLDWYGFYSSGTASNPTGPSTGDMKSLRGGSWFSIADYIRAADRGSEVPSKATIDFGFRCAQAANALP